MCYTYFKCIFYLDGSQFLLYIDTQYNMRIRLDLNAVATIHILTLCPLHTNYQSVLGVAHTDPFSELGTWPIQHTTDPAHDQSCALLFLHMTDLVIDRSGAQQIRCITNPTHDRSDTQPIWHATHLTHKSSGTQPICFCSPFYFWKFWGAIVWEVCIETSQYWPL